MNRKIKAIAYSTILFLYLPIFVLAIYSFNSSKLVNIWGGFSIKWYQSLINNTTILESLATSFNIALCTGIISTIIGIWISFALYRSENNKIIKFITIVTYVQFTIPEIILGLSLLLLYAIMGQSFGFPSSRNFFTVVIAHCCFTFPYVVVIMQSRLASLNRQIIEAAYDLGATNYVIIKDFITPHLLPAIINSFIMSFIISLDDFIIATFTTGPGTTTLPMLINSKLRLGLSPEINALGTIIIAIIISILVLRILYSYISMKLQLNKQSAQK